MEINIEATYGNIGRGKLGISRLEPHIGTGSLGSYEMETINE